VASSNTAFTKLAKMNEIWRFVNTQNVIRHAGYYFEGRIIMRKSIFLAVRLTVLVIILAGCVPNQRPGEIPKDQMLSEKPEDFSIILKYGVRAKNVLNTKDGTFTKDLISAGTETTELKLSNDELALVYDAMQKINIMKYPEVFKPDSSQFVRPYQTYDLTINYAGQDKRVFWEDESLSRGPEATQLREVFEKIKSIIECKDEFKRMAEPVGGYH
jgi:hypothetical protein